MSLEEKTSLEEKGENLSETKMDLKIKFQIFDIIEKLQNYLVSSIGEYRNDICMAVGQFIEIAKEEELVDSAFLLKNYFYAKYNMDIIVQNEFPETMHSMDELYDHINNPIGFVKLFKEIFNF
jgi:hypothetical protein